MRERNSLDKARVAADRAEKRAGRKLISVARHTVERLICAVCVLATMMTGGCGRKQQSPVLRVAIPYSDYIQEPSTNYYLGWLKEQTGLDIEVITVRQNRSLEYLEGMFASGADVDVVMFGGDLTIDEDEIMRFYREGYIYSSDGQQVYYPNYGYEAENYVGQILWINYEWLSALGLSVPRTTDELEEVLMAFKMRDPNANGLADEIPLAGTAESYVFSPQELVLNSFVYNDPFHGRFEAESITANEAADGQGGAAGGEAVAAVAGDQDGAAAAAGKSERCVCVTEEFREGLRYIRKLYAEGLIDSEVFSGSTSRFTELVNSPVDLVGAFVTDSISDVIYPGNPEIMARYIHVPPLEGPEGVKHALYNEDSPAVGAIITAQSTKKEEAKLLLDTMMSPEASLIARYGEEGVDWEYSRGTDVNAYGGASSIVTKNYIWNTPQNKHLNGIGPLGRQDASLEGVTWNGVNSDTEYIDARARTSYREWLAEASADYTPTREYAAYVDGAIRDFVTGARDPDSDEAWREYVEGVEKIR